MEGSRERCKERDLMERRQARKKRGHLPSGGRGSGGRWSWCVGETTGLDQWLGRMLRRVLALGVPARRAPPAANAQVGQAVAPVSGSGRNSRVVQGFNVRKREPGRVDGRGRVQAARRKQDLPGHPPSAENLEGDQLWAIRSTSTASLLAARYCVVTALLRTATAYRCEFGARKCPPNICEGLSHRHLLCLNGPAGLAGPVPLLEADAAIVGRCSRVFGASSSSQLAGPASANWRLWGAMPAGPATQQHDVARWTRTFAVLFFSCSAPSWAIMGHHGPQLGRTPFFPLPLLHCCVCAKP